MTAPPHGDLPARLGDKFLDFDKEDVFRRAEQHAASISSKNFVVEFGFEQARIAFDLGAADFRNFLKSKRDVDSYPVRWINVWDPTDQDEIIAAIGSEYDFSERLIGLMGSFKEVGKPESGTDVNPNAQQQSHDVEKSLHSPPSPKERLDQEDDSIQLYLQLKDTVNYFSTDQTQKALCIGAHWLHKRPAGQDEPSRKSMMPPKHWQWLTLCNDHTVVSVHEKPSFESFEGTQYDQTRQNHELKSIRANTLNVLLQLSKHGYDLFRTRPLSLNPVRKSLNRQASDRPTLNRQGTGRSFSTNGAPADEGTSNLFYYLFEDYIAAGPLKMAETKLDQMTRKVLASARPKVRTKSTDIIPTLHYLSKDLRELKHLFENYRNLIGKIMSFSKSHPHSTTDQAEDHTRLALTDSAMNRFERLRDRLGFLMLNTIEGYLEEISALSSTYFNLTQQKDSEATARLTRSATLLAKLSVFFLPISFMTSYFSVQIEDLFQYWTATDYWYSFAVIASVSFVSLFFFGRLLIFFSDVLDEWSSKIARWCRRLLKLIGIYRLLKKDEEEEEA
ncbi:hypothetical protein F5Y15DRAFT_207663 [Xylariaceae sp. FL0016]|nr:hypothetical protein F5Y15DRAFT_207663 [Xylariaceae sp. FL0016]